MSYQALIAGCVDLRITPEGSVRYGTDSGHCRIGELLQQCPESLLLYDTLFLESNLLDSLYHDALKINRHSLNLFCHLVELQVIQPLDVARYPDLNPEDVAHTGVMCEMLIEAAPDLKLSGFDAGGLAGLLLEMQASAKRHVRPFTWDSRLVRGLIQLREALKSKRVRRRMAKAHFQRLKAAFCEHRGAVDVDPEQVDEDMRRLLEFGPLCGKLELQTNRSLGNPRPPTMAEAFRALIPDIVLIHDDDSRATGRSLELLLETRTRMPALRRKLQVVGDALEASIATTDLGTERERHAVQRHVQNELHSVHEIILDAFPSTRRLHWLATNPYVAASIGYFVPFADIAAGHIATAMMSHRLYGTSQGEVEDDAVVDVSWYFEYLDVAQTYQRHDLVNRLLSMRRWFTPH